MFKDTKSFILYLIIVTIFSIYSIVFFNNIYVKIGGFILLAGAFVIVLRYIGKINKNINNLLHWIIAILLFVLTLLIHPHT